MRSRIPLRAHIDIHDHSLTTMKTSHQEVGFAFNQYWLSNWEYNSKYVRLTETNPFSCQHCGKRYRWKSTLKRHESFECGGKEPAHKCPHCDYRAKQSGNLRVHIRKYHTERTNVGNSSISGAASLSIVSDLLPAASSGKSGSRSRCTYTRIQIQELEKEFVLSHYVSSHRRQILATKLNLTDRQIKVWFQNRRSKEKRNSYSTEITESLTNIGDNLSSDEHEQRIYEKALQSVRKEEPSEVSDNNQQQNLSEHPLKKIMKLMPHYYSD